MVQNDVVLDARTVFFFFSSRAIQNNVVLDCGSLKQRRFETVLNHLSKTTSFCIGLKKKPKTASFYVLERPNDVVLVWFAEKRTFVHAIPDAGRKKGKMKRKKKRKMKKRKMKKKRKKKRI